MRALASALGCLLIAAKASSACSVVPVVETLPSSPNVRLIVLKDGTPHEKTPNVIRLEADEEGRFSIPLNPGSYTVAFQSLGFKTRLVGFVIGPDESQGPVPIVLQVGSCS